MSDPNPYDRPIRIRSLSDVNAAINTIAHKSANLIGLSVMKGQVFRADFVIGAKAKPTPLAPSRTFSLFFVPQAMKEKSFVTTFIKKTGGLKASTLRRADATTTWKYNFPESDEHIHFALTGANRFGDRNVYFFSVSPGRPDVKEAVSGMIQNLKKSDLGRDFQDESALMRSRWIGPGVVAGVLLLEALILVLSSSSVYRFGRGSDAGLPNLAAAVFFLVMGGLAFLRRIRITYLFLLLTEAATITNLIVVAILSHKLHLSFTFQNFGITLLHLFLLVFIPIRGQDFNIFSLRQFYKRVFFGFRDWAKM